MAKKPTFLYTAKEIAQRLGVKARTIYRWKKEDPIRYKSSKLFLFIKDNIGEIDNALKEKDFVKLKKLNKIIKNILEEV